MVIIPANYACNTAQRPGHAEPQLAIFITITIRRGDSGEPHHHMTCGPTDGYDYSTRQVGLFHYGGGAQVSGYALCLSFRCWDTHIISESTGYQYRICTYHI